MIKRTWPALFVRDVFFQHLARLRAGSAVVLEDMVLVSRRLEDLKKGLGLGFDKIVLILAVL
jgi:hypothetical protein